MGWSGRTKPLSRWRRRSARGGRCARSSSSTTSTMERRRLRYEFLCHSRVGNKRTTCVMVSSYRTINACNNHQKYYKCVATHIVPKKIWLPYERNTLKSSIILRSSVRPKCFPSRAAQHFTKDICKSWTVRRLSSTQKCLYNLIVIILAREN